MNTDRPGDNRGRLERCTYKLRNTQNCQRRRKLREGHETHSPLEVSEGARPRQHLDLDLWPPDL